MSAIATAHLSDVASFVRGITFKPDDVVPVGSDGSVACMRTKNVQSDLDLSDVWGIPESFVKRDDQYLQAGDVLVSSANSWNLVGKCCWVPTLPWEATFGGFISVLRGDREKIEPRYLYHWFASPRIQATVRSFGQQTTNISNLNVERCLHLRLPLPPLPEQRRIAGILDKADAVRAKRRAAIVHLHALTHSIFLDMFGDPATNPMGWPVRRLGDLFEICSSKRVLESQWRKEGIPFYRAREIVKLANQGYVDNDLFISEDLFNELSGESGAPTAGDLMVSAVGTLGACYQVHDGDRFYFKDASVLRFVPKGEVEPCFVRHAFNTDHVLRQVHAGSGSTVGTYTIARARQMELYAPPLALQRHFSGLVERVERQSALQTTGLNESDRLFAALQHRAFLGGL
jgi:type I restriction enzyme, S subunit